MKTKIFLLSLLTTFFVSCDDYFSDMDIKNEYSPNIETVMADASQYPSLLSGVCVSYWNYFLGYGDASFWPFPVNADQFAASAGNWDAKKYMYYAQCEKPEIDNYDEAAAFPKQFWNDLYAMINTLKDILKAIDNGAVYREGGEDLNYKILANAYFLMGSCYTEMALLFDQGVLITETTDVSNITAESLVSASEVQKQALDYLDKCIQICQQKGDFTNLANMFPNGTMSTGNKVSQLANFMAARCLAYFPRTNDEAVDWNRIKGYAQKALQEDIVVSLPNSDYATFTCVGQASPTTGWNRVGMRILKMMCPNDANAVWPLPIDFSSTAGLPEFNSPDKRLQTYFTYAPAEKSPAGTTFSGYQNYSPYALNRFNDWTDDDQGTMYLYTLAESDLLYAEALVNTNDIANAVTLINKTRVNNGELTALTASDSKDDVLRALYYERFIESDFPNPVTPFYDRRRTPLDEFQLATRSFRQLPVPYYDLKNFGLESYTFGGAKDENSKYKF